MSRETSVSVGILCQCWTRVGFGPATEDTLKTALCQICTLVGHMINTERDQCARRYFWQCRTRVGFGPATGPTLKTAQCHTCLVVGRMTNPRETSAYGQALNVAGLGHTSVGGVGRFTDLVRCVLARLTGRSRFALTGNLEPQGAVPTPKALTLHGGPRLLPYRLRRPFLEVC